MANDTIIQRLASHPLSVPLKAPFNIATSTLSAIDNLAVEIRLADGSTGWGEIPLLPPVTEDRDIVQDLLKQESKLLAGRNAVDWHLIASELRQRIPEYATARCGIEMALVDALLHSWCMPMYRFFGGASNSVITDITIPICPADEAGQLAKVYKNGGFTIIKSKIGNDIDKDLKRILAIKHGFSDCRLILDANTGYSVNETLGFLAELRKMSIVPDLLEQPLAREDWDGMGQLAREAGVPIAADESCRSFQDAERIISEGLAQVINIKLAKCGVAEALDIAAIARANNIGLMIGGMVETRIAMGFSAHFAAGLGGFEWIDLDTPLLLADDPVIGGYKAEGPTYKLDTGDFGHGGRLKKIT
jgi:L-alanine-DL-glutamate epimerase-like enolase superfamily enzyme